MIGKSDHSRAGAVRSAGAAIVLCAATLLGGCMQSNSGSNSGEDQPYVYKGRADPLMAQPAEERAARLTERFRLVQARQ